MLELKNIPIDNINRNKSVNERFIYMKNLMDKKMASYLRLLATKNYVNRASTYHYLNLAVTDSTAPVNGIDYIHPVVKPAVDYCTAVIAKGLMPNGEINFEFTGDGEDDEAAARQATNMVSKVVNQMNDPHFILERWIMDAALNKNGMLMIKPVREQITRYVEIQGTNDQLAAFETQALESGLTATRQSKRRSTVQLDKVSAEVQQLLGAKQQEYADTRIDDFISQLGGSDVELDDDETMMQTALDDEQTILRDAIRRNTVYNAKYKLTGYNVNIKFHPISQHYWLCDPTVPEMKDQPFCGYYDPMTIQEATELYPGIDLEQFERFAEYNMNGAFQAGSVLNNLAIHARDSVPLPGVPVSSATSIDPPSRQVTIVTVWNRFDIDGDGELELIEMIYSGSYIISAREVEFIPVAGMCPKPLPGNFYGMSIAESVIPMQEYATSATRAEIQLGLLTATPRLGVKPDRLDFEMLQDGEAAIFILDSKFDPAKDVYPVPPPSGNLAFLEQSMTRIQQDAMAMIGMTTPQDVFNPEVMSPGNSGIKLQLALTPNQIIQDNTVRNCAEGLKQALYLVWRTLVEYADDYGVKKLAASCHPDKTPVFLDGQSFEEMNFIDRKNIQIELALGLRSEENALARLQIIQKCQADLYATVQGMVGAGTLTPTIYKKVKKPFADTLYCLGVKDCDTYLPSDEEVLEMIQQAQAAKENAEPSPDEQVKTAKAQLDTAKAQQIMAEVTGQDAETTLDYMAIATGKPKVYS